MNAIALRGQSLPVDQDPARVYLSRLGPGSRRTMGQALRTILEIGGENGRFRNLSDGPYHKPGVVYRLNSGNPLGKCGVLGGVSVEGFPWHRLRYQHTQAVRTALAAQYSAATANKILSALKGVLKEAWRLGQMDSEAYHRAIDMSPVRGETLPRGRALPRAELDRLFSVCRDDPGPTGRRDLAILSVLYGAGLRRQEVARLGVQDYLASTSCLTVLGKGSKLRTVYLKNGQKQALETWIEVRGQQAGAMFLGSGGKGRPLTSRALSVDAIYAVCKARARQAGIPDFSPHDLRRTAISDMLDAGADISAVKAVAGHSKIDTTSRYDRRGERAKEAAAALLEV